MKIKIVKAKVRTQKVNCHLKPGFLGVSMCTDKLLKKIGGKISRKLTPEEKDSKFVREETTAPLGLAVIPLIFTSNVIKNHRLSNYESITIPTEVLVEKYNPQTPNFILLVTDAENALVRTTLRIKDLSWKVGTAKAKRKPRVNVYVNKRSIHDFYKSLPEKSKDSLPRRLNTSNSDTFSNSDISDSDSSDSSNSSSSCSGSEDKHIYKTVAVIHPKRCRKDHNVLRKYISPKNPYRQCIKCRRAYRFSVDTQLRYHQYCYLCSRKQAVLTIQRIFRLWHRRRIDSAKIIQNAIIKWLYRPDGSFMNDSSDSSNSSSSCSGSEDKHIYKTVAVIHPKRCRKDHNVLRKYISPKNPYRQCIKCRRAYRFSVDTQLRYHQYCYLCSRKQAVLTIQRIFRLWHRRRIDSAKIIQNAIIKWLYRPDGSFMK
ncbi:hypothetical protein Glove_198g82 [Diversispora epigaea]|uniref:Uncharacterized protein n=1 Tax=Diversispora epigaea TaxID=1348612 RepID=A0A397IKD1_9GLOM|nr:hypothetical protein Glove_198g82 [Diversispora epigaea]